MQNHRVPGGFTLVEMLAVVVLLGILSSMAFGPSMEWVAASRVDNAARVVAGDLRLAVALASRQGRPILLEFAPDGLSYRLRDRASHRVLHERAMGEGSEVPIGSAAPSSTTLLIYPNRLTSEPFAVTLSAGPRARRITMSSAGFVQVVDP